MSNKKLDHYNPNYTYKKETITIDKNTGVDYPMLESVGNAALFPDALKHNIDLEQLKPHH